MVSSSPIECIIFSVSQDFLGPRLFILWIFIIMRVLLSTTRKIIAFSEKKKTFRVGTKWNFTQVRQSLPKTKFHVQLSLLCWCWHPEWRTLPHQCYLAADIFFSRTFPHPQGGWIIYCGNLVSYAGRGFDMGGWESVRRCKSPQHPSFKQIKQLNSVQTNQHMPGTLVSLHTL